MLWGRLRLVWTLHLLLRNLGVALVALAAGPAAPDAALAATGAAVVGLGAALEAAVVGTVGPLRAALAAALGVLRYNTELEGPRAPMY